MLGHVLDEAVHQLEDGNPELLAGALEGGASFERIGAARLQNLVEYFSDIPLRDDYLEFDDTIGLAYNRALRWFGDRAGVKGGVPYTPESIVELMVRLVQPREGQSVYDPFVGSGGMLVQAKKYVDDHGEVGAHLSLFGQEKNVSTSSVARLNLLLNGVRDGSILCGDTLERPLHALADGRLKLFDRVLTNPPFSSNYDKTGVSYPERMRYGWTSKQADMMNVQHVLAVLRPDGVGAVVTPHGVLFRGGAEAEIRKGILEDGRVEAVIGIGANVFQGTAIPACILVLRGRKGSPENGCGSVLFINAEREVASGRTQNRLEPAHVEKIVQAFRGWSEIPNFSRVVSLGEIAQNGFNLNIRRYVDANPAVEVHLDVRGALFGGVPRREIQAAVPGFQAFGIDLMKLFRIKSAGYLDFLPEGYEVTAAHIPELSAPREHEFLDRYRNWWERAEAKIAERAGTGRLMMLRSDLMSSFSEDLLFQGMLDQPQLSGAFADWWSDRYDDFRSLDLRGFAGVVDRWATTRRPPVSREADQSARERVLDTLGNDLRSRVEKLVFMERQELADMYHSWGEQYATSLADLEEQDEAVAARIRARLRELGYADQF
jgi:type I restriction enzyme M protein